MRLFSENTKADALGRTALFEGLPRRDLEQLAMQTEDLDVAAGKVLCREGDIGQEFFVIVEGEADVTQKGRHIRTCGPGDFFGEIALLEKTRRTATVTAKTPLRFFVLTRQNFWSVVDSHPDIERTILRTLAKRLFDDEHVKGETAG